MDQAVWDDSGLISDKHAAAANEGTARCSSSSPPLEYDHIEMIDYAIIGLGEEGKQREGKQRRTRRPKKRGHGTMRIPSMDAQATPPKLPPLPLQDVSNVSNNRQLLQRPKVTRRASLEGLQHRNPGCTLREGIASVTDPRALHSLVVVGPRRRRSLPDAAASSVPQLMVDQLRERFHLKRTKSLVNPYSKLPCLRGTVLGSNFVEG